MSDGKELYQALLKFQGQVRGVARDKSNSHFRNKYATLEAVTDAIRGPMQECGLVWFQTPGAVRDGALDIRTVIVHAETGQSIDFTLSMPLAKKDPQGVGSAMTYGMRYSLMAALGLPPVDDDGEGAIDRNNERPAPQEKSRPTSVNSSPVLSKDKARGHYANLEKSLRENSTTEDLRRWWKDPECVAARKVLPEDWQKSLYDEFVKHGTELKQKENDDGFPGSNEDNKDAA